MMSPSKGKEVGDKSPWEVLQWKQRPPTDDVVKDLLCLRRIRDFLCLILSYPMRIGIEEFLKGWTNEVMRFCAHNSEQMAMALLYSRGDDKNMSRNEGMLLSDSFQKWVKLLLFISPLKVVEGLIPKHIIADIINDGSFIFNNASNTSEKLIAATSSTIEETQLKNVPDPILPLATHLAVHQLLQTVLSPYRYYPELNIQNVMFSTRDVAEKQIAVEKMVKGFGDASSYSNLKYWGVIVLNVANNQDDDKQFQVLDPEVRRWLEQIMGTKFQKNDDSTLPARKRKRNIVVVVDGDGDKKLDLSKVWFPKRGNNRDVVVFITTESSSAQQIDELTLLKMDVVIRTEDHVLPWEVFCENVGSELVLRASSSSDIQRIAVQIVEECGANLLAILLVAKSLHNVEDAQLWRLALEKVCYPNLIYSDVIRRRVERRETYCPNVLENAFINIIWVDVIFETKKPLLSRCLRAFKLKHYLKMGDEELFKIWLSEKLVDSQKEAEHTLRELINCSILLQFEDTSGRYLLLPKEIRDILEALLEKKILYENLNKGGSGLTEPPNVWHWHGAVRIDLMNNNISELPQSPNCPTLQELYLNGNANLMEIPSSFFQRMPLLQLLDLSHTGIPDLPSSIFKLAHLKTLYLRECKQFNQLPPEIEQLTNLEKLDLGGTTISNLPESLILPKLTGLFLQGNLDLMEIPPSFFDHMPWLAILDLSRTSIHDLPSSFFNLEELTEFYLKNCEIFIELPPQIGRLRKLKNLDLDGTQITHLPKEIEELTNLESLSLAFSGYHRNSGHGKNSVPSVSSAMIPLGFIQKLTHLKYLKIDVNPDNEWWHNYVEHILAEIAELGKLLTLELYIPEVKLFRLDLRRSTFRLIVGHHTQRIISRAPPAVEVKFKQSNDSLRFVNGVDIPSEVENILRFARTLFLDRHMTINHLTEFGLENLQRLELCILGECNEMQSIVDGDETHIIALINLQFLTIFYMKNLRSIVGQAKLHVYAFFRLKFLALHTCPELTTILAEHFLVYLGNLEEVIVEDCPKVSTLITSQSSTPTKGKFLPSLRKLSLLHLPELVTISNGLHIGESLETIGFYDCPKLITLSSTELSSEKLKVIRGEIKWWKALNWNEVEWGQGGRPHKFSQIFSPIDEDLDVLTQLMRNSMSNEVKDSDDDGDDDGDYDDDYEVSDKMLQGVESKRRFDFEPLLNPWGRERGNPI